MDGGGGMGISIWTGEGEGGNYLGGGWGWGLLVLEELDGRRVGLIAVRLEQSSGMKEPQEGDEGAGMGRSDREDEEKEEEEVLPVVPTQKWRRAESGIVTRGKKVAKQDGEKDKEGGENGKRGVRTWNQTRRAMGL
ncbi:hypothetical protein EDC04DRAFT_2601228 [Pisolithus marmoratus]|nr:hypothetical protein EDC04DRAFT_2601228 [Pisolithus marmoratus]